MQFNEFISGLKGIKQISHNNIMCLCPAHADKKPSLHVQVTNDRILVSCLAGCSTESVMQALGLSMKDLFFNSNVVSKEIEAVYDYRDGNNILRYQVVRFRPKSFRHRRPNGAGDWIWNKEGVEPLLYQTPELLEAISNDNSVFIVEGEKDCQTLGKYGLVATTCSGGAKGWRPQFSEIFYDAKVVIIPDNDDAGLEYAEGIARLIYGWAKSLKLIKLDVPRGGDVTDYLNTKDVQSLINCVQDEPEYMPKGAVTREEFTSLIKHLVYLNSHLKPLRKIPYRRKGYET